ncbi:MAG: hypothetical protein U0R71_12520 [Solirubrobacterales bacterium]
MKLVRRPARRKLGASLALTLLALAALFAVGFGSGSAGAAGCPSFRVLHNDRIGPAVLPAGPYSVTPAPGSGLSCSQTSQLFARFLEDWDGNLPGNWRVVAQGSGRAKFLNGSRLGFTVERNGGEREEEEKNPVIGELCPGTFTVNHTTIVGPLRFRQGRYLIYIPSGSGITCRRASVLFTRFLGQPGGRLPFPWQVKNQTATFYKPAHPVRSSFRLETRAGVR